MSKRRIVLTGGPYEEPRYGGEVKWSETDVYLRHPGGGKDSRHSDRRTHLKSTETSRKVETRLPTSSVSRELVNFIGLSRGMTEPPILRGEPGGTDIIIDCNVAGASPRIAVEIVVNERVEGVRQAYESRSTVSSVQTILDKGRGQSLIVALASTWTSVPSTGK